MKGTRENIIQALTSCTGTSCKNCPFFHDNEKCEALDESVLEILKQDKKRRDDEKRKIVESFAEELKSLIRVGSEMNGDCSMCIVHDLNDVIDDVVKESLSRDS